MKKGEMSISTMVGIVIGLIALIIMGGLFLSKVGITSKSLSDCEEKGGACIYLPCHDGFMKVEYTCPAAQNCCFDMGDQEITVEDGGALS